MSKDGKMQFVCFETTLDKELFIKRWEKYNRSPNSNDHVILQQSDKNGLFRYIAQHSFESGELQFVFSSEGRTSRIAQARISTKHAGGYSILQAQRLNSAIASERKVFVFITDPKVNINLFKKLSVSGQLNIYEAYYENCKYAYILEYFVKTKEAPLLIEQLNAFDIAEAGIYKECALVKDPDTGKKEGVYVWPTV